ncbi:MAG: GGDEF domain-containing protein [Candidatus Acidiferrales bacterium]
MTVQSTPVVSGRSDAEELLNFTPGSSSNHKTLPFKPRRSGAEKDLEGSLVSALLSTDKELTQVLGQLDEISSALKSGKPPDEILRVALHPAVWYAVKHALVERELRHLALCDDLTCLYNRRGFFAAATQQMKMARRNDKPALLLSCDLDGLKAINDRFGHREGDMSLVRAADALQSAFRDSDVLARLGGDEFAVLAMDLPLRHQQTILTRLRKELNKLGKDQFRYQLSLSVGTAWFDPQHPISLAELMEQADRDMYEHKRNNQVSLAPRENEDARKTATAVKLNLAQSLK